MGDGSGVGRRCGPNEMDLLNGAPQLELTRNFEMVDGFGFFRGDRRGHG